MFLTDVFSYADNKTKASLRESSKKTTSATTKHGNEKYPQTNNCMVKENTMKTRDILENSSYGPDLIAARGLIGKALHDQAARQEYFNFIKVLRDKHGADYSTKIHQAATELAKAKPAPLDEAKIGIPGNDAWIEAVTKAKSSGERAGMLYNMFQNIPKRHFYDFVKAVGAHIDPKFEKELLKAKQIGAAKNLRQDRNIVAEEENPKDIITLDVPLFIRLLEYAREDAKTDMDLHNVTERIISLSGQGNTLTMSEYNKIVGK